MYIDQDTTQITLLQTDASFQENGHKEYQTLGQAHAKQFEHSNFDQAKTKNVVSSGFVSRSLVKHKNAGILVVIPREIKLHNEQFARAGQALYCKFKVGIHTHKTAFSFKTSDERICWDGDLRFKIKDHKMMKIKVKEYQHKHIGKNKVGDNVILLEKAFALGKVHEWIPIFQHSSRIGELLLEMKFIRK